MYYIIIIINNIYQSTNNVINIDIFHKTIQYLLINILSNMKNTIIVLKISIN